MASVTMITVLLFLFFATVAEGDKKKSSDKIIIHVPYKIHKHHHTHTKYKVITIPAPKKEHTVIYLKEHLQPVIKEVPVTHTQVEIKEDQSVVPKSTYQVPEAITPPHQQSAQSFLASLSDSKMQNPIQTDQEQEYSTITTDQKPLETHISQHSEGLIPNLSNKPIILSSHNKFVQDFSFKPMGFALHPAYSEKFFLQPAIHHSYNSFLPKFTYQSLVHPQNHFNTQFPLKSALGNPKVLHDNVAHSSSQMYKTMVPGPKAASYKVKEEIQEGEHIKLVKHQHKSNAIPVPLPKPLRKGKKNVQFHKNQMTKLVGLPFNHDYEYEHVGYLIIDGNSRKIVGKNFNELHFSG